MSGWDEVPPALDTPHRLPARVPAAHLGGRSAVGGPVPRQPRGAVGLDGVVGDRGGVHGGLDRDGPSAIGAKVRSRRYVKSTSRFAARGGGNRRWLPGRKGDGP